MTLALWLSGCASLQQSPSGSIDRSWEDRQARLSELNTWQMTARLSLSSPEQTQTLNMDWQEWPDSYQIRLTSHFGQTIAVMTGNANSVSVTTQEGTWQGNTLEDFASHEYHLSLPFSAFRYWLLGLPAPGVLQDQILDANHRLVQLQQNDWLITYRDYDVHTDLPRRLRLEHEQWRINWLIQDWQLPANLAAALQ